MSNFEDIHVKPEKSGGSVSYYQVLITNPTSPRRRPYTAECNDLIEALGLSFAEANILKAIWRIAAARNLGKLKEGFENPRYDTEKIVFFADRMLKQLPAIPSIPSIPSIAKVMK